MNRREFSTLSLVSAIATSLFPTLASDTTVSPKHEMPSPGTPPVGHIGMLLYPGFTAQDLVGPQLMFAAAMDRRVHLVAKTMAPVHCDTGFSIVPTTTLAECPKDLEILFVPGGSEGTADTMLDTVLLKFLADRGSRAKYITAICTGTFVLAAAGLLKGRRAATHWVATEVLPLLDVTPVSQRVVVDSNCITGGGVTAGLDFGLYMLAQLKGEDYARAAQLSLEYTPKPPFNAGTPETAGADAVNIVTAMYAPLVEAYMAAARTARNRLDARFF